MAELATIARPYAEALFRAVAGSAQADEVGRQLAMLESLAGDAELQQFVGNPSVPAEKILDLVKGLMSEPVSAPINNLLALILENGRFATLPEIAHQFHALSTARAGTADALVQSAFPVEPAELSRLGAALEKRFGRKLNLEVAIDESLIGGVRVVVGDEVLDTSVQAQLSRMKSALTA